MKMKNKSGAMEMTVGTIVTIVLLMSALVLGLILTKTIFTKTTENVQNIDAQVKGEINGLFGEDGTGFVIRLGNDNTARVKQGTPNFGIPIGFAPTDPRAWDRTNVPSKENCKYTVAPVSTTATPSECVKDGWTLANINAAIKTGTTNITFAGFQDNNGYALIKIDIPSNVPPCMQPFKITIMCAGYPLETVSDTFYIEILKKGIF